jgi:hypothetical protein
MDLYVLTNEYRYKAIAYTATASIPQNRDTSMLSKSTISIPVTMPNIDIPHNLFIFLNIIESNLK